MLSSAEDLARKMTWGFWAGDLDKAAVTPAGQATLSWAIDVLRETFGERWLSDNARTSRTVPLLQSEWHPLANARVVVRVLELATRIELVLGQPGMAALLQDAQRVGSTRETVVRDFQHLLIELEVAAFAIMQGWSVSHECQLPSGRKPDLWLARNGIEYLVEVTALGFDRNFRRTDEWSHALFMRLRALEHHYQVQTASSLDELLDEKGTGELLDAVEEAAQLTSRDGMHRTVQVEGSTVQIAPEGEQMEVRATGPMQQHDVWARVATRLVEKAAQTRGGPPAWLRIDDMGALFSLTDWSQRPLTVRLGQLANNVALALQGAPHVRGVVLSSGVQYGMGDGVSETCWDKSGRLVDGPAALRRLLPKGLQRLTFVIPGRHKHIELPSSVGLEPGLWYDQEPDWLDRALSYLNKPSLSVVLR